MYKNSILRNEKENRRFFLFDRQIVVAVVSFIVCFIVLTMTVEDNYHASHNSSVTSKTSTRSIGFTASTDEALSLYTGCASSSFNRSYIQSATYSGTLPDVIIIGTQKGGTTSVQMELTKFGCNGGVGSYPYFIEKHFFGRAIFAERQPSFNEIHRYSSSFSECVPTNSGNMRFEGKTIVFEKTPNYIYVPWAAKRFCEIMSPSKQKVVLFLRDPVVRAYSSFYQDKTCQVCQLLGSFMWRVHCQAVLLVTHLLTVFYINDFK